MSFELKKGVAGCPALLNQRKLRVKLTHCRGRVPDSQPKQFLGSASLHHALHQLASIVGCELRSLGNDSLSSGRQLAGQHELRVIGLTHGSVETLARGRRWAGDRNTERLDSADPSASQHWRGIDVYLSRAQPH